MDLNTNVSHAFNVVFKELIVLIKTETTDKELKSAVKQKYKKFETGGDSYLAEYEAASIIGRSAAVVEASLADKDAVARFNAILPLLDCFKTLSDLDVAQCILSQIYAAIVAKSADGLKGVILDKLLSEKVCAAVNGVDPETVDAFASSKLVKSTDIMSIVQDVSKTINVEELMKNGMDPSGSTMQDMVSNVSKDIQHRIDSGEVDQEQLMKEASDLLSSIGGGGGLAEMMKLMHSSASAQR